MLDTVAALNFRAWRRIKAAPELARVWRERGEWAWTPRDRAEVDGFCDAVYRIGRLVVVVDESSTWLDSARGRGSALERLFRSARHPDVYVALTSQYAGADVSRQVLACRPGVFVFRTPQPLGALGEQYEIGPEDAKNLAPRECIARE